MSAAGIYGNAAQCRITRITQISQGGKTQWYIHGKHLKKHTLQAGISNFYFSGVTPHRQTGLSRKHV